MSIPLDPPCATTYEELQDVIATTRRLAEKGHIALFDAFDRAEIHSKDGTEDALAIAETKLYEAAERVAAMRHALRNHIAPPEYTGPRYRIGDRVRWIAEDATVGPKDMGLIAVEKGEIRTVVAVSRDGRKLMLAGREEQGVFGWTSATNVEPA